MTDMDLSINGQVERVRADGRTTLLDVLRDQLRLAGAKRGCNYGVCGACTVLIDGVPARSCLSLAHNCDDRAIETVEALDADGPLHRLQQALVEGGAVQCGFCTPGIVMALKGLLDREAKPDADAIRHALGGNMCRCTGYAAMVAAVTRLVQA